MKHHWNTTVAHLTFMILGGVLLTLTVCGLLAFFGPRSLMWSIAHERDEIQRVLAAVRLVPGDVRVDYVSASSGLGYHAWRFAQLDRPAVRGAPAPKIEHIRYSTEVGWPYRALATNSTRIGRRAFENPYATDAPSNDSSGDLRIRIIWSGLLANCLLYGALLLMGFALLRTAFRKRFLGSVVIASSLALWVAIIAAWGCDLLFRTWSPFGNQIDVLYDPSAFSTQVHSIEIPEESKWSAFMGLEWRTFGYREWQAQFTKAGTNMVLQPMESEIALGWPVACLRGPTLPYWVAGGDPWPGESKRRHLYQLTALPIAWPGLLADWLFYTLMVLALMRGPGFVRTWRRRCGGRCPACGYRWGTSPVCTECGVELPPAR